MSINLKLGHKRVRGLIIAQQTTFGYGRFDPKVSLVWNRNSALDMIFNQPRKLVHECMCHVLYRLSIIIHFMLKILKSRGQSNNIRTKVDIMFRWLTRIIKWGSIIKYLRGRRTGFHKVFLIVRSCMRSTWINKKTNNSAPQIYIHHQPTIQANLKLHPHFWNENSNTPKEYGFHNSFPH